MKVLILTVKCRINSDQNASRPPRPCHLTPCSASTSAMQCWKRFFLSRKLRLKRYSFFDPSATKRFVCSASRSFVRPCSSHRIWAASTLPRACGTWDSSNIRSGKSFLCRYSWPRSRSLQGMVCHVRYIVDQSTHGLSCRGQTAPLVIGVPRATFWRAPSQLIAHQQFAEAQDLDEVEIL